MFVVPCKWTENCLVEDSINSILKYHPNEKIVVVDSDSDNKDYFNNLPDSVIVADIKNKNYMEGALWYCYENYPEEDFFYLVQDSMISIKNADSFKERDVTTLSYFPFQYNPSTYGTHTMRNYAQNEIKTKTFYNFIEPRWAMFGPTVYIKRHILDRLKSKGFDKILPTNKMEMEAMERIWAIVLEQEGFPMVNIGLVVNTSFAQNNYFIKHWLNRQ